MTDPVSELRRARDLVDDLFAALDTGDFTAGAAALERLDEWRTAAPVAGCVRDEAAA